MANKKPNTEGVNELTILTTFGLAPAFNRHLVISVSPIETAISKGVAPQGPKFASAPAYAIELYKYHNNDEGHCQAQVKY